MRLTPWIVGSWPVRATPDEGGKKLVFVNVTGHKAILEPDGDQVRVTCDDGRRHEQHVLPPVMAETFAIRWLILRSQFSVGRN